MKRYPLDVKGKKIRRRNVGARKARRWKGLALDVAKGSKKW